MSTADLDTLPFWSSSASFPSFAPLEDDADADVVVVGGGITGLTAAYLLSKAGKRVVVLERDRCALADTGHTSAHLTMVTDTRLSELVSRWGRDHAQAVWDAGLAAIAQVDQIVREERIDGGFAWVDGYLHAPIDGATTEQADALKVEATVAAELGFDATYLDAVPFAGVPGVRVEGQARIHPRTYLAGLASAMVSAGGRICEQSDVRAFHDAPRRVEANGHTVRCDAIVIATHNPVAGLGGSTAATLFQTKLALYTSYVIGARVAKGTVPDALWWDTGDPYRYLRIEPQDDHDLFIVGGEDHKTGQQLDTEACYRRLETLVARLAPGATVAFRWSGQVIETPDGLPYIGASAAGQYSATGFAGNGLTFGTLAGMMSTDGILGRRNPWAELFDPGRPAVAHGLWEYLKENADYPYYAIRDRFAGAESRSLRSVKAGEGKVVDFRGQKVAAYRDRSGVLSRRSAACSHMGCVVGWNPAERTWDCPCHGSRFRPTGEVISGPAQLPLPDVE